MTRADVSLLHTLKLTDLLVSLKGVATGNLPVLNRVPKFGYFPLMYNPCILGTPKYKVTNFSCGLKQKTNKNNTHVKKGIHKTRSGWDIISE